MLTRVSQFRGIKQNSVANSIGQNETVIRKSSLIQNNRAESITQRYLSGIIQSKSSEVAQLRRFKYVEESGRRHYDDGWGALYGIQNDNSLKAEVQNDQLGNWTRDLGEFYHAGEGHRRPCTVGYRNRNRVRRRGGREVNDTVTSIYHCGPSSQ